MKFEFEIEVEDKEQKDNDGNPVIKLEKRSYERNRANGRVIRLFLQMQEDVKGWDEGDPRFLDKLYEYMTEFYGNKFSSDLFEEIDIEDTLGNWSEIKKFLGNKMGNSVAKYEKN